MTFIGILFSVHLLCVFLLFVFIHLSVFFFLHLLDLRCAACGVKRVNEKNVYSFQVDSKQEETKARIG